MIKPNENVIRAILNLENNVSWREILQWLEASLVDQSIKNNSLTGEDTIKGQGKGLNLAEIIKHIKSARTYESNKGA